MKTLSLLIGILVPLPTLAEIYTSPSSAYFGHVPVGFEEFRNIKVCGDVLTPDNLQKLQFSEVALRPFFQVEEQGWDKNCLRLRITFTPDVAQGNDYQVYGKLPGGKRWYLWPFKVSSDEGNRLQAVFPDRVVDLVPVMGTGVSRKVWEQKIRPSGWRFSGYVTYQHPFPNEDKKFIFFRDGDFLKRKLFATSNASRSFLQFQLDPHNIPNLIYPVKDDRTDNRMHWVTTHKTLRWLATAGKKGQLSVWHRRKSDWQESVLSLENGRYLFVNDSYAPAFNAAGNCLLIPDADLNHLRRIRWDSDIHWAEMTPYNVPSGVWALSPGPGLAFVFAGPGENTIHECELNAYSCEIFECTTIPSQGRNRPYATDISPNGDWLVAAYSGRDNLPMIRLWKRENDRIVSPEPVSELVRTNKTEHPGIMFHGDSRQLFMFSRTYLKIINVSSLGEMKESGTYDFEQPEMYLRSAPPTWMFNFMAFNEAGNRLYMGAALAEGGMVMFDHIKEGGSASFYESEKK